MFNFFNFGFISVFYGWGKFKKLFFQLVFLIWFRKGSEQKPCKTLLNLLFFLNHLKLQSVLALRMVCFSGAIDRSKIWHFFQWLLWSLLWSWHPSPELRRILPSRARPKQRQHLRMPGSWSWRRSSRTSWTLWSIEPISATALKLSSFWRPALNHTIQYWKNWTHCESAELGETNFMGKSKLWPLMIVEPRKLPVNIGYGYAV